MGGYLVAKLVKPTKVFCSRPAQQADVDHLSSPQTKSYIGAGKGALYALLATGIAMTYTRVS